MCISGMYSNCSGMSRGGIICVANCFDNHNLYVHLKIMYFSLLIRYNQDQ